MIYLDNAATTKTIDEAAKVALKYYTEDYYNPSALYRAASIVHGEMDSAAKIIAGALNADKNELVFTSCATESSNMVFECGIKNKKGNVIVSEMEHPSVYEAAKRLAGKGTDVRFAKINKNGIVDVDYFEKLVDENTALVSIIHCSNETGAVNDIKTLAGITKSKSKALFHSDGVQSFLKIDSDVKKLGVDYYSVSAHKIGGLKGVGLLYINKSLNIPALIVGGGQQGGRRSGTENVGGIISFAKAVEEYKKASKVFDSGLARGIFAGKLRDAGWARINALESENSGYIVSISFQGIKGEVLSRILEDKGIIVGIGSACSSHAKTNRTLTAMGVGKDYINGTIRVSFNPFLSMEDISYAADVIISEAAKLRGTING